MLAYHRRHGADVTVGVRRYEIDVPYGVVECDGAAVQGIREKPSVGFLVNAGIYLLEPSVPRDIPTGTRFDMTDLIARLLAAGRRVVSFPIVEYWLDVGRHDDYRRANEDAAVGEKG
jgi:NDP-sugar pyrophosphorylase family protein